MKKTGKIIAPSDMNVWPHEYQTARALAGTGRTVTFVRRDEGQHRKSPDILMDGATWEIKAPNGSSMKTVERNVRKACAQSQNVVFDSKRIKKIPDAAVERELRACASGRVKELGRLIFVNKKRKVIDIK